jgi:hypothetical protein
MLYTPLSGLQIQILGASRSYLKAVSNNLLDARQTQKGRCVCVDYKLRQSVFAQSNNDK